MRSRLDISAVELIEARDSTKNQKTSLTPIHEPTDAADEQEMTEEQFMAARTTL